MESPDREGSKVVAVLGQVLPRLRQVVNLSVTLKRAGLASEGGVPTEHTAWTGCALLTNKQASNKESILGKSPTLSTDIGEAGGWSPERKL